MSRREKILEKIKKIKESSEEYRIGFSSEEGFKCSLVAVSKSILERGEDISLLSKWRQENDFAFPAQFKVTDLGTKTWCEKGLFATPDRILFWVLDHEKKKIGHVGLFRLSEDAEFIEADNIVRGESSQVKGIMADAMRALIKWQREYLEIPRSYLRVFSDNARAIDFYKRLNYAEIQRVPLYSERSTGRTDWKEIVNNPYAPAEKYFVTMQLAPA